MRKLIAATAVLLTLLVGAAPAVSGHAEAGRGIVAPQGRGI